LLPVLHCEHLENSDESYRERIVIGTWHLYIWSKVIVTLKDLATKQSVDENEDEHQDSDENEVHEGALDDTDYHGHGFESA